jgi:hypothetical protein
MGLPERGDGEKRPSGAFLWALQRRRAVVSRPCPATEPRRCARRRPGAAERIGHEIARPRAIQAGIGPEPRPLAIETREALPAWTAKHGYDEEATEILNRLIGAITRSAPYLAAWPRPF